ncbi:MAG: AsmA family protein [Pseudomonadales bacterium]|nr:AsmA family protein [Pseudomonadales bacterium]NRA16120.1 AsmA family protein [Oceanospirillaceae bacterium]
MKKLIKILATLILIVLVLAVAGGTLLGLFVDPNDYREDIEKAALDNAAIELQIEGDIGWSVFPWLGLEIASIKVAYPGQQALASLQSAQVSVMVMPLLSGDIKMKAVTVEGLELNLIKTAEGNNWQAKASADASAAPSDTESTTADDQTATKRSLEIDKIAIINAKVTYSDTVTGEITTISDLNLNTDRVVLGQAFNAQLNFIVDLVKQGKKQLSSKVDFNANFIIDPSAQRYQIRDLASEINLSSDKNYQFKFNADIDADMAANTISIDNLAVASAGMLATGKLQVSGEQLDQLSGNLAIAAFDLKALLKEMQLPAINTSDDASLRKVAFSTKLSGSLQQLNLSALQLRLDDTKIAGSASYQLASGLIGFNLKGDAIDLNRYLPKPAKDAATTASSAADNATSSSAKAAAYSKDIIIELQPLRDLKLKGQLLFDSITYQKTNVAKLDLKVDANGGLVKISKLNLQVYGGSISNNIRLDARKETLAIAIDNNINKLQLGPVLVDFAATDALTGTLLSSSNLTARGQSIHSIINSLNGKVQFTLADGVVKGIDAAQEMCETINKVASLGGVASKTVAIDKSTPFASIKGQLNLKNGVVSNNDFAADLDAINATGKGTVNLPAQSLNYRIGLKIQDNLFKKSCSVNNAIQGIEWPIDCKGNFSDEPMKLCKPDLSVVKDIAKKALKAKLQKKLGTSVKQKTQEVKQKVEEQVQDKLKGLLKGLF